MAHSFPGYSRILFSMLLLVAISFACQATGGGTPEAEISDTPQVMEVDIELGPGSFDYPDSSAGLETLSSFKARLTVSFDGTENGQVKQWSNTSILTYQKEPLARTLTFETTAVVENPQPAFRAEMNGAEYEQMADGNCFANPLDPDNSLIEFLNPVIALGGVLGAEEAGQETVNGIETNHYTFDERALGQAGLNESSGELWVAKEGGYLLRYHLTTEGEENYFGEGIVGTFTWDYELSEVNQVPTIQLPENCPAGMVDAPMLPDAFNITNMPGLLKYETATSVAEARAFYEHELPKLGWQVLVAPTSGAPEGMTEEEYQQMLQQMEQFGLAQPTPTPDPNQAFLDFMQGEYSMSLTINAGETGTHVMITVSRSPQ
jgi:hypothetical protein